MHNILSPIYKLNLLGKILICISLLGRYGFRGTPLLFVSARPKLGDRQVKLTHVTEWIEKKLKQEFRVSVPRMHAIVFVTFPSLKLNRLKPQHTILVKWPCLLQVCLIRQNTTPGVCEISITRICEQLVADAAAVFPSSIRLCLFCFLFGICVSLPKTLKFSSVLHFFQIVQ